MEILQWNRMTEDAILPVRNNPTDSGFDVFVTETKMLQPGERHTFSTGIRAMIPSGFELVGRPRSGMARKKGVTVLNSPATIDEEYRGEIKLVLINHSSDPIWIYSGDKVAQLVLQRRYDCMCIEVDSNAFETDTNRGDKGFGSSGYNNKKEVK